MLGWGSVQCASQLEQGRAVNAAVWMQQVSVGDDPPGAASDAECRPQGWAPRGRPRACGARQRHTALEHILSWLVPSGSLSKTGTAFSGAAGVLAPPFLASCEATGGVQGR